MNIKVRLFATLRNGRGKELDMQFTEGTAVQMVIEALSIPEDEVSILLVNGRNANIDQVLKDGDTVSIFPPVGGG